MKRFTQEISEFIRDESGQSATEYVLLLLFVVMAVKTVGKQLGTKLEGLMGTVFSKTEAEINN